MTSDLYQVFIPVFLSLQYVAVKGKVRWKTALLCFISGPRTQDSVTVCILAAILSRGFITVLILGCSFLTFCILGSYYLGLNKILPKN